MRLIEAIHEMVRQYPHHIAVEDSKERLNYQALWERAGQASRGLGSGKPGFVILQEPRSCQLIVSLLSVWRAGHAPLLLDPDTPARRTQELTQVVRPLGSPDPRDSSGVEYLVTTSGSSGQPKVVRIGVGSLHRVIQYQIEEFQLNCSSSVGWILSPGFDASLSDIGTTLCSGAKLVCLESLCSLKDVTHLDIPPALLRVYDPGEFPSTLRTLVVGGEASSPELLRAWARHHRLVAVYGPSETTVCSSTAVVDEHWDKAYLGKPLPGVSYTVERNELLIGGPTVGLGYLDDSEAFFQCNGVRWYRTGDRVGPVHDRFGHLFSGRSDRQVQLRGQRFEPEEVEQRATSLLDSEAACEVWNDQVVLCWRTLGKPCTEEKRLRQALQEQLMPAWLPQHYLALEGLPRNEVHKIDRLRLRTLLDRRLTDQLTSLERLAVPRNSEPLDPSPRQPHAPTLQRKSSKKPGSLLVTGITGRLGRALQPMLQDRYEVWSLQRQKDDDRSFQIDLAKPEFGLAAKEWDFLKNGTDEVLHLAAQVDLSLDLDSLRPTNVDPTAVLLRLGKPIHFASTLAVPLCTDGSVFGGYAQSKWLVEQLLTDTPGLTLRYGHLIGRPFEDELLAIVVKGLVQLGCCPKHSDPNLCFDWTPIEWAATRTFQLLENAENGRDTAPIRRGWHFHLNDLAEILGDLKQAEPTDSRTFFNLAPQTREAALAQAAMWKCRPGPPTNRGFDLFLLGNSEEMLGMSKRGPRVELARYLERLLTE